MVGLAPLCQAQGADQGLLHSDNLHDHASALLQVDSRWQVAMVAVETSQQHVQDPLETGARIEDPTQLYIDV